MPALTGATRVRLLPKPGGHAPLASFRCGNSGKATKEVHAIVRRLHRGEEPPSKVLVMEDGDELVGVISYRYQNLVGRNGQQIPGGAYIAVIGRAARYRKRRLEDGRRIGSALLGAALNCIQLDCGEMPYTWALVGPSNAPSLNMFKEHAFEMAPAPRAPGSDAILLRPGATGLPAPVIV